MTDRPSSTEPTNFVQEVGKRGLWQVLGLFVGGGWGLLQVLDLFIERGFVPEWVFTGALLALALGLPVVLTTAFVQGGKKGGAPDFDGLDPTKLFTWHRAIVGGILAFALLGAITAGYMVMRVTGIGAPGTLVAQGVFEVGGKILLADFESSVGDVAPGDLITEALRIDLAQSSALSLVESGPLNAALRRMLRETGAPLTEEVALELAVREGIAGVISGEVGRLGSGFVITARLLAPESGAVLAPFRVTAANEGELIDAIDELSSRMREKVGESMRSVAASGSLEQVTTTSLEALRKYTTALHGLERGLISAPIAIQLLRESVALDSTFASGHRALLISINNYGGDQEVAAAASAAAFRHRTRLPDRERLVVEASYYSFTGDDNAQAMRAFRSMLAIDDQDHTAVGNLSHLLNLAGQYQEAIEVSRSLPDWPSGAWGWNYAVALATTGRTDEAVAVFDTALISRPDNPYHTASIALLLAATGLPHSAAPVLAVAPPNPDGPAQAWQTYITGVTHSLSGQHAAAAEQYGAERRLRAQYQSPSERITFGLAQPWISALILSDADLAARQVTELRDEVGWEDLSSFNRDYAHFALTYAVIGDDDFATEMLDGFQEVSSAALPHQRAQAGIARSLVDIRARGEAALPGFVDAAGRLEFKRYRDFLLGWGFDLAGQTEAAIDAYEQYVQYPFYDAATFVTHLFSPTVHERLGELYEAKEDPSPDDRVRAAEHYRRFAEYWADADTAQRSRVDTARRRAEELEATG